MPRLGRVPDPGEHVCDRISHKSSTLSVLRARCDVRFLPGTLCHPSDVSLERELAEAEAAQRKLTDVGARAAAAAAAVTQPDLELRRLRLFCDLRGGSHFVLDGGLKTRPTRS